MKAKDLMTREVISIGPQARLLEALSVMLKHQLSGLPVIDANGKLVGIVTEGDLLRRAETGTERQMPWWKTLLFGVDRAAREYTRSHALTVESLMTSEVHSVGADAALETVVETMERYHIKRVPVIKDGELVGIVSRRDLLRPLFWLMKDPSCKTSLDADIARALDKELAAHFWSEARAFTTTIRQGVVELEGVVFSEAQREAVKVLAQNVDGVKEVKDRLITVHPIAGVVMPGKVVGG